MRKILISGIIILALLCLTGCGDNTAKEAAESELINETSFPAGNTESPFETEAVSEEAETEAAVSAEVGTEQEDQKAETEQVIASGQIVQAESNAPQVEETSAQSAVQEQAEKVSQTQSEVETEQKPTEAATTEATVAPKQEQTMVFDVAPYVEYAKSYAKSIGLMLDSTATDCWDNPITANATRSGIEADIQSRLNRYKNTEGFTAVCIWTEKVSDTEYEIYIGYY